MTSAIPNLRACQIDAISRPRATLVEIAVPKPKKSAIALVFDMSDSCRPMVREIEKLPKLLVPLPRELELWSYTLSNAALMHDAADHTLAHIHDGSISLVNWLTDVGCREHAESCGSFLRPVIEAIEKDRLTREIGHVTVLVITDGELTDGAPVCVPENISVIGITSQDKRNSTLWNRVVPSCPLCTLSDAVLDTRLKASVEPFFTECRVEVQELPSQKCELLQFDAVAKSLRTLANAGVSWNFIDGSLFLIMTATQEELASTRIRCTSTRTAQSAVLEITSASAQIDPQMLTRVGNAYESQGGSNCQLLLDVDRLHAEFVTIWKSFVEAATLAEKRDRWTDNQGALKVFSESAFLSSLVGVNGRANFDAILCMANCDIAAEPSPTTRFIIVGLEKRLRPALLWRGGESLPFAIPSADVLIEHDQRESRWSIRFGDSPAEELEPCGSQKIEKRLPVSSDERWVLFFSGDLR